MKFARIFNFHPILFGIFPVISIFSNNIDSVIINGLNELFILIIAMASLAFFCWWIIGIILKNKTKAGLLVSFSFIMIFIYGHIQFFFDKIIDDVLFLSIWIIVFAAGIFGILKIKKDLKKILPILFVIALTWVTLPLVDIANYQLGISAYRDLSETDVIEISSESQVNYKPDIYYFIFDKHASFKTLENFYDYQNKDFLNFLDEKGFYIATDSHSNYKQTFQSVASTVSMKYINYLSEVGGPTNNKGVINELILECKICKFIKSQGYKYIHFGSIWPISKSSNIADVNVNYFNNGLPDFTELFFETTLAYPILTGTFPKFDEEKIERHTEEWNKEHYERILFKFNKLKEIPQISEPTFVFAHFITPHGPYIFDENGDYVSIEEGKKIKEKERYTNQVTFIDKKIRDLVEHILDESEEPPIIIIQSDEGPVPKRYHTVGGNNFDWHTSTIEEVEKKMGILNVFYLPNVDNSILYPSISSVNTFRVVFNLYFGTDLELLPDHHYAYNRPNVFDFVNVTEKIHNSSLKNVDFEEKLYQEFDWKKIGIDDFEYNKHANLADLLNVYYQREDLQIAFPEVEDGELKNLLNWVDEYGQAVYTELSEHNYGDLN